jgi:hypothetical protein
METIRGREVADRYDYGYATRAAVTDPDRPGPARSRPARSARECQGEVSGPGRQAIERVQRSQIVLDVSAADLQTAESVLGPFHPTTRHFRDAWYDAQRDLDRLRAELGSAALKAALNEPPLVVLDLGAGRDVSGPDRAGRWPMPEPEAIAGASQSVLLIAIAGLTYCAFRVAGTALAPRLWRLTRLNPPHEDGPYYAGRLHDGSTQCDCADWTYHIAETDPRAHCKHLAALAGLGWL